MKFQEILQEQGVQFRTEGHHHCRTGWIQFDCPYCGKGSHKWHMGFNLAYGYVNCWRCGRHRLQETLAEVCGLELRECRKLLVGVELEERAEKVERGELVVPRSVGELLPPHRRYLLKRRFDPDELVTLWNIGGIGSKGSIEGLAWRLYIPIHFRGEVVSWTTRSISEETKKKYRTAEAYQESIAHHSLLYGEDYVRMTALVFEGPPDVWRVGPGAVCTFGTQWSNEQLNKLSKYPRRVICFDNEQAAQARAMKLCAKLSLLDGETYNVTVSRTGRDFDPLTVRKLRKAWL